MSVHKAAARLLDAEGALIGEGRAFVHLRQPSNESQPAQGTLSLDWWNEAIQTPAAQLQLAEGPLLALRLESDRMSSCVVGRILRYQTHWPGA